MFVKIATGVQFHPFFSINDFYKMLNKSVPLKIKISEPGCMIPKCYVTYSVNQYSFASIEWLPGCAFHSLVHTTSISITNPITRYWARNVSANIKPFSVIFKPCKMCALLT